MFKYLFYSVSFCLLAFGLFAIYERASELQQTPTSPAQSGTVDSSNLTRENLPPLPVSTFAATPTRHPGSGTATPTANIDQANIDFMAGLLRDMTSSENNSSSNKSNSGNGNKAEPLTSQDHLKLGYALLSRDRNYSEAINEFTITLGLDPYNVDATYYRGIAYVLGGRPDLGLQDYNRALQLKPDYAEIYNDRGNLYSVYMYDYARAIADYKKAILLNPRMGQAYLSLALCYYNQDDYETALTILNKAIEVNPYSDKGYNYRGLTNSQLGESDLAIEDFTRAIKLNPKYGAAYDNRAWEYEYTDNNSAALADFKMVLEVSSDSDLRRDAQQEIRSLEGD